MLLSHPPQLGLAAGQRWDLQGHRWVRHLRVSQSWAPSPVLVGPGAGIALPDVGSLLLWPPCPQSPAPPLSKSASWGTV